MESDDPAVAAMHLAYAATFDPSVYVRWRAGAAAPRATARWCATSDVYRKMPRTPRRGTVVGVYPAARPVLFSMLDRTLRYADRFPLTDDRSDGAEGAVRVFAGLLLRPYPSSSPAVVRKLAERRVRLREAGDVVRAGFSELRRGRHALNTADLGMVFDAVATLLALDALHPPHAATGPEYSPMKNRRTCNGRRRHGATMRMRDLDVPAWRMWVNRCMAGRCHSRTAAFLASGTVYALHKDDPAAREEQGKSGEPLRVRPLSVGSAQVRLASAHALGQVGADAREVMGPVQRSFQSGAGCETAYMSMRVALQLFGGRGTGGKGLLLLDIRNAFDEISRGAILYGLLQHPPYYCIFMA
eukprot:jgi/Tetstr1/434294/TSEL_023401.t1